VDGKSWGSCRKEDGGSWSDSWKVESRSCCRTSKVDGGNCSNISRAEACSSLKVEHGSSSRASKVMGGSSISSPKVARDNCSRVISKIEGGSWGSISSKFSISSHRSVQRSSSRWCKSEESEYEYEGGAETRSEDIVGSGWS
jgi:hypothetical protein